MCNDRPKFYDRVAIVGLSRFVGLPGNLGGSLDRCVRGSVGTRGRCVVTVQIGNLPDASWRLMNGRLDRKGGHRLIKMLQAWDCKGTMDVTVVSADQRKLQRVRLLARLQDRFWTGRCILLLLDRRKGE